MKLIIQIPCFNEEETLAITLGQLPRQVNGFDVVEWLVIDDGSTDKTVSIAKLNGVNHVVSLNRNQGLARGFMIGLDTCLKLGADVIVNTDADNQYDARDIVKLVEPILQKRVDIVVGARPISDIEHFSPLKKFFQKIGSLVVRKLSNTHVEDAPSGFRALSRDAAMRLNVFSEFTYTLETIIQAGRKNMVVLSVPIRTNPELRQSRLFKSIPSYIKKSIVTMIRIFVVYKPFRFFIWISILLFLFGIAIGVRFLWLSYIHGENGHTQSLILASVFLGAGFQTLLFGFLADLQSVNRKLLEDLQYKIKKMDLNATSQDSGD